MRVLILAVGQHISDWAQDAVRGYLGRFPRSWRARLMQLEGSRILEALEEDDYVVVLDEHGKDFTTTEFARSLNEWMSEASRVVFVIGGPDGLAPEVKEKARRLMRLSAMTMPHALARVFLAEQLYRVWSIGAGHPYHRA